MLETMTLTFSNLTDAVKCYLHAQALATGPNESAVLTAKANDGQESAYVGVWANSDTHTLTELSSVWHSTALWIN